MSEESPTQPDLPSRIRDRLARLQASVEEIVSAGDAQVTVAPPDVSFQIQAVRPGCDILTDGERAQSVSFVTRYQGLPKQVDVRVVRVDDEFRLANIAFVRHTLNEFRPIVMNARDPVHYQKVHATWRRMLVRESVLEGTIIRARSDAGADETPTFVQWFDQTKSAIQLMLRPIDLDYLYNGVLQHSDATMAARFVGSPGTELEFAL